METTPVARSVTTFLFKQGGTHNIFNELKSIPFGSDLLAADNNYGVLYAAYENKLMVIKLDESKSNIDWKLEHELPAIISKISLSCDYKYLAVTPLRPLVLIYSTSALVRSGLELVQEIRVPNSNEDAFIRDIRWNPCIPGMLCAITNEYTMGTFQVKGEKTTTLEICAMERLQNIQPICASWSPKGKQIAVGCRNGSVIQLKPDLKVARNIPGPNPTLGETISIVWISNYQFCVAYLDSNEQRFNVVIVDAPKGEANARFTNFEDLTFATLEGDNHRYYFQHIPEWGLIIAASSGSCDIAVLGTANNGGSWEQWQPPEGGTAELPLHEKTETTYPVGFAVDRSATQQLPWGVDGFLPSPVPILHIFGTSGVLTSFHLVNLHSQTPSLCSAPTQTVAPPRPSITPSEISFNPNTAITSTPRPKKEAPTERTKPLPATNLAKAKPEPPPEPPKPPKPNPDLKVPSSEESAAAVSEAVKQEYDESAYIPLFRELQSTFEREIRDKLETDGTLNLECGTEDERRQLNEKTAIIDQFLRDLKETTNGLTSDISYLKALLLQSFAWMEESKSKNAANFSATSRSGSESNKLVELKRLFYNNQSQLAQALKLLDLNWDDHASREKSKMKMPSLEFIHQSLLKHGQIVNSIKAKADGLTKKWNNILRKETSSNLSDSLSDLHLSKMPSNGTSRVIELKCNSIAAKTRNFTPLKECNLRAMLLESPPKVIRPVNPSPVQDRLEATLSSLASSTAPVEKVKPKTPPKSEPKAPPAQSPSPLASLNSIVARVGGDQPQVQPKAQPQLKSTDKSTFSFGKPEDTVKKDKVEPAKAESTSIFSGAAAPGKPKQAIGKSGASPAPVGKANVPSEPKPTFSFPLAAKPPAKDSGLAPAPAESSSTATTSSPIFKNVGATTFSFAMKPSVPQAPTKSPLDLLNLSLQASEISSSQAAAKPATLGATAPVTTAVAGPQVSTVSTSSFDIGKLSVAPSSTFATSTLGTVPSLSEMTMNPKFTKEGNGTMTTTFSSPGTKAPTVGQPSVKDTTPAVAGKAPTAVASTASSPLFSSPNQPLSSAKPSTAMGSTLSSMQNTFAQLSAAATSTNAPTFGTAPTSSALSAFNFGNAISITLVAPTTAATAATPTPTATTTTTTATLPAVAAVTTSAPAPAPVMTSTPSIFGGKPIDLTATSNQFGRALSFATSATPGPFGTPSSSSSATSPGTAATAAAPAVSAASPFGKSPSAEGGTTGSTTSSSGSNVFGVSGTPAAGTGTGNIFGGNATANTPVFGEKTGSSTIFGGNASTMLSFGTTPTAPGLMSGTGFGSPAAGAKPAGSGFGAAPSIFGGTASNATPTASMGAAPTFGFGQASTFGSKPAFGAQSSVFGTSSASPFGAAPVFGSAAAPTGFGGPPTMGGSPPPLGSNAPKVFGGAVGNTTFGSLAEQSGGLSFGSLSPKSPAAEQPPASFSERKSFQSWR